MGLNKIFIIVFGITILSLLYVYQQSNIIQLAYQEQERLALLENLVNKNNNLRYNLDRQMSLVSIAGLWQEGNFEWPNRKQLLSFSTTQQEPVQSKQIKETESIFTHFFGLKSQAEATSVKSR